MRNVAYLCVGLSLLAASSCGNREESLVLTSDASALAADGMTVVELSAAVVFRGDPLPDGKRVTFSATDALLFELREDVDADVTFGRQVGETEVETETRGGSARAYLLAPLDAATLTITASFTTVNKDVLSDVMLLEVGPPPLISGGDGDGSASSTLERFKLNCDAVNIGAFVPSRSEAIEVGCTLILQDHDGRPLPHTPVELYAEAGEFRDQPATARHARAITYVVQTSPAILPRDVTPSPAAQNAALFAGGAGAGYDSNAAEANPRDGLVTLLAVVRGHEGFEDLNGNGTYDAGEAFIDEGEPFLDVNDDGVWNANDDPAHCCDANGNGVVDGPNGRWDEEALIGRMVHILWTGRADGERSYISPPSPEIAAQDGTTFRLFFSDRNFNPVASNSTSDDVRVEASTTRVRVTPLELETGEPLAATTGMILNSTFPGFIFGEGDAVMNPVFLDLDTRNSLLHGREWSFVVADDRSPSTICNGTPDTWDVTGRLRYTPAPGETRLTDDETASGTLQELPDTDPICQ